MSGYASRVPVTAGDSVFQRIERINLHGLHFQHIDLYERSAWTYLHKVNFA